MFYVKVNHPRICIAKLGPTSKTGGLLVLFNVLVSTKTLKKDYLQLSSVVIKIKNSVLRKLKKLCIFLTISYLTSI